MPEDFRQQTRRWGQLKVDSANYKAWVRNAKWLSGRDELLRREAREALKLHERRRRSARVETREYVGANIIQQQILLETVMNELMGEKPTSPAARELKKKIIAFYFRPVALHGVQQTLHALNGVSLLTEMKLKDSDAVVREASELMKKVRTLEEYQDELINREIGKGGLTHVTHLVSHTLGGLKTVLDSILIEAQTKT